MKQTIDNTEKKKIIHSLIFPVFFLIVIWIIKFIEYSFNYEFYRHGIFPQNIYKIYGIALSPLIHSDFDHLISNSVSFVVLSVALFYFYRKDSYKIFFLIYFITGFWVWLAASQAYHIGASGLIYGIASFLIFSGFINKHKALTAVSLTVVFAYGSMVWGVLPLQEGISWESHLFGAVTGLLLSLFFARKIKTKQKIKSNFFDDEFSDYSSTDESYTEIRYFYEEDE